MNADTNQPQDATRAAKSVPTGNVRIDVALAAMVDLCGLLDSIRMDDALHADALIDAAIEAIEDFGYELELTAGDVPRAGRLT